jgi:PiT family inorganic phosphate transporter
VATLYGSGTASYRRALAVAVVTTLLGSLAAAVTADQLLIAFSGKGLVPDSLVASPSFALSVGVGAAGTVALATLLGFPISTTHALVGALAGAGLVAGGVDLMRLGSTFFLPLLVSPVLALVLTSGLYPMLRRMRLGLSETTCVCVVQREPAIAVEGVKALSVASTPFVEVGSPEVCRTPDGVRLAGFSLAQSLDVAHYTSAALVGFARGLNDTPKIAALLLMASAAAVDRTQAVVAVALAMAVGGLLSARKVAQRMSKEVTTLNQGQGLTANLVTSVLVLGASRLGVPVSTTHVSCGSLFGIGMATGGGRGRTILSIVASWMVTLPVAVALSALTCSIVGKG